MVVNGRLHDQITTVWNKKQAANTHDIKLIADTLDALQTGRPGQKLRLCLDKGYDAG